MKKLISIFAVCVMLLALPLAVCGAQLSASVWVTEGEGGSAYLSSDAHGGSYSLAHAGSGRYSLTTYQEVAVPNGTYTLTGYVKSSGGQSACWLAASQYGGNELRGSISASQGWEQVTVENIQVTAEKAVITVWSNTAVQAWLLVDDLSLTDESGKNYLENGDFETVGTVVETGDQAQDDTPPQEAIKKVASKFFEKWVNYANPSSDVAYIVEGGYQGNYCGVHYFETTDYTVGTTQLISALENGTYGVSAWVRSSGGQTAAQLVVKAAGKNYVANIPTSDQWQQITVTDVPVTEGTLEVSIWSDAKAGQWVMYDELAAYSLEDPSVNLLSNPGFETLGVSPLEQDSSNIGAEGAGAQEETQTAPTLPQLELNEEEDLPEGEDSGKKPVSIDWLFVGSIAIIVLCTAVSLTTTVLLLKKNKKES